MASIFALISIALAAFVYHWLLGLQGLDPSPHLSHHTLIFRPNLISDNAGTELRALINTMGVEGIPTNTQDTNFYQTTHEHIGEAVPVEADGSCSHPFMVPNRNGTLCILPGRVDIGRHFVTTGGPDGVKESYTTLVSRLLSFGVYLFDPARYESVDRLFQDEKFQKLAKDVCPDDKQVLDPFQFNFIIQAPGQTVAAHVDGVYFWGASRFNLPQWLLAVMKFSALFEKEFVDQVQVVGYLHEWMPSEERKGNFIFWDGSSRMGKLEEPLPLGGSGVDGTKTVHAANVYMPQAQPPRITKDMKALLKHAGGDNWTVVDHHSDGSEEVLEHYKTDDLRTTIVYRARCFRNQEEVQRYRRDLETHENDMRLEDVLKRLADDLVKRGKVRSANQALEMPRMRLALLLMDTYLQYPNPTKSLIPVNYCALDRLVPWTKPFIQLICQ